MFFYTDYRVFFLQNEAIGNVPPYIHFNRLPFWSIQLVDFIVPEANLVPLLTLWLKYILQRVSLHEILDWKPIFSSSNLNDTVRSLVKKINTRLAFVYYPNGPNGTTITSHVNANRMTELLFGTHTYNFNCFFNDFNCIFTQISCLSRLLSFDFPKTRTNQLHVTAR